MCSGACLPKLATAKLMLWNMSVTITELTFWIALSVLTANPIPSSTAAEFALRSKLSTNTELMLYSKHHSTIEKPVYSSTYDNYLSCALEHRFCHFYTSTLDKVFNIY